MNELRKLVKSLEKAVNEKEQIEILKAIGKELVSNYVIMLPDNIEVLPLWVEAYYADVDNIKDPNKTISDDKFIDPFIHGDPTQKGEENFGKLYFHHKTDDQRSGVDICLPCGSYYLSFLLKYTLVNNMFTTQSQLSGQIRTAYEKKLNDEQQSQILKRVKNEPECVTCTTRIGLNAKKEKDPEKKKRKERYKLMNLAIVRDFHKTFSASPSLPRKETLVKQYLDESNKTIEEKAAFCRTYLGYCPSKYKEK